MIVVCLLSLRNSLIHSSQNPEIYNIRMNRLSKNRPTLEHIFPKCYMNKRSFNDMHNIFSCNDVINNARSNYKFGDFDYENLNFSNFKRIDDTDNYYSHKDKLFIPEQLSRGIIARAIMYMSYEYKYKYNKVIDYEVLINWCMKYPPTIEEINHNNLVFKKQFKRNRFIDLYNKKNYYNYIARLFL